MIAPLELASDLLDPLTFCAEALAVDGALVERGEGSLFAVMPPGLAARLGVGEEVRLAAAPDAGAPDAAAPAVTACGFGTVFLEKALAAMRGDVAACWVQAEVERPRPQQARALAEKLAPRNAVMDLLEVSAAEGLHLGAWFAYEAEADDRVEGLVALVAALEDASEPDDPVATLLDPTRGRRHLRETPPGSPLPAAALAVLARRAERAIRQATVDFAEGVARRHDRDHGRTRDYFAELMAETRSPRRKVDPAAIAAKLEHLAREEESKLRDVHARYALTLSARLAALVVARVPEVVVRARIRRRKGERELRLRLPGGARTLSRLACAGCAAGTARPAFCDDALHVICEACAPSAQGRLACPACRAQGSGAARSG